jgi:Domain of unknown function (DUF4351)
MSQFPHDEFAKDLLETLLTPFGKVETDRTMGSEVREIDVYFTPSAQVVDLPSLGLLQKCAATPASFEPFRNPVAINEVRSCMAKLFDLHTELIRLAKRLGQTKPTESQLPHLWILTPTLAAQKLTDLGAITKVEEWGEGVYLLPPTMKTGIIMIHQLAVTPETLWLRILGRDNVQARAVDEISNLPADSPQRGNVLKLFSALKVVLESKQNRTPKESESLMKLTTSPVFLEYVERITQDGRIEEGRSLVLRLLNRKLGNLSPKVQAQVNNLTIERVESLGEDLLDFTSIADLEAWFS